MKAILDNLVLVFAQTSNDGGEIDTGLPLADAILRYLQDELPGWLIQAFDQFAVDIIDSLKNAVLSFYEGLFEALITPLVMTPAPIGNSPGMGINLAFRGATNTPWNTLISEVYYGGIAGLALGIQFLALAAVGLRYQSMNPVVRKKVGKRIGLAFLSIFLWLPLASAALQIFDTIGRELVFASYTQETAADTLFSAGLLAAVSGPGLIAYLIVLTVLTYVFMKALFIAVARWILLIVLTLSMPLVASFWALEVWPLNEFAGISKQVSGTYPGLVAAGIPPAILIRISLIVSETDAAWGLPGIYSIFVALVTLFIAAKAQKEMITRSSRVSVRVSEQVLGGAKKSVKKPLKVGGAVTAGAVTLGAAGAAGGAGAKATSGAVSTASSAAKGRLGRTAFNAQRLHRGLSNIERSDDDDSDSDDSDSDASGSGITGGSNPDPGPGPAKGGIDPNPDRNTDSNPTNGGSDPNPDPDPNNGGSKPGPDSGSDSNQEAQQPQYWSFVESVSGGSTEPDTPNEDEPTSSEQASGTSPATDNESSSSNPTESSDSDGSPAATTDPSSEELKNLFAGGNEVLGPGYYRDPQRSADN